MIKFIATAAGIAALATVPAAQAKTTTCKSGSTKIHKLHATNVPCATARSFARSFAHGASYQHSPYKAKYRGYSCTIAAKPSGSTTSCKSGTKRISWVRTIPKSQR